MNEIFWLFALTISVISRSFFLHRCYVVCQKAEKAEVNLLSPMKVESESIFRCYIHTHLDVNVEICERL